MKKLKALSVLALAFLAVNVNADPYRHMATYHVKITNTTAHHVITPPTIIAHNKYFKLFQVGSKEHPASAGLELMAETGDNSMLISEVEADPNVSVVVNGGAPIPYGESLVVEVKAPPYTYFTVAGMLASTNDAFVAATVRAPWRGQYSSRYAMTYDAGTEMNNELCEFIPGPPCSPESGNAETGDEENEGFITIHNGIYGKADLPAEYFDWRGPTAKVSIHRQK